MSGSSAIASSLNAFWKVEPLPLSVPERAAQSRLAPATVVPDPLLLAGRGGRVVAAARGGEQGQGRHEADQNGEGPLG